MPAKDIYHQAVKNAMLKDGWTITHDPFRIRLARGKNLFVDLGAEQLVFDRTRDSVSAPGYRLRYLLVEAGQENGRRTYGTLLHLDIINGKIWIQLFGGTEAGIANELVALGVPKECVVLGFKSLQRRQVTEFAVS